MRYCWVHGCLFLSALSGCAAEPQAAVDPAAPALLAPADAVAIEPRLYDIRDILSITPRFFYADNRLGPHHTANFDLNNALSSTNSGGTLIDQRSRLIHDLCNMPRRIVTRDAIARITDSIADPAHWDPDRPGVRYRIRELHGNLVIFTTPQHHGEIESLLNHLRVERGVTTWWELHDKPDLPDFDIGPRSDADNDASP